MAAFLFRSKPKYVTVKPQQQEASTPSQAPREVPDGLWTKCDECGTILYNKELKKHAFVCTKCGYHARVSAADRIEQLVDEGSFHEFDGHITTQNPLGFPEYEEKVARSSQRSGLNEAVVFGEATIDGMAMELGIVDFNYMGGSMGTAMGEKIARAFERACEKRIPVVLFSAGGGARMQEGILSLMQMAKTSQAIELHSRAGLFFVSVLTNPTMGGNYASFATLADVIVAEPRALIGFAGPKIVEESTRQKLPTGFQSAEFALDHGMVDMIVDRREMRERLSQLLKYHQQAEAV